METSTEITHAELTELLPNPYQPHSRIEIKEETAKEFGMSILDKGLLQIPVCRTVIKSPGVVELQMVDGWLRRSGFAWLVANGHPEYHLMPIVLREFTDQQMADMILVANQERKDLTPIDLAWYYKTYLAEFKSVTQSKFAETLKVSQGEIANTIRLLELPETVQDMIITQEITPTHGRSLLQMKSPARIFEFACNAISLKWTVAELDAQIKNYLESQNPKMDIAPPANIETVIPAGDEHEEKGIDTGAGDEAGESGDGADEAIGESGDEDVNAGGVSDTSVKPGREKKGSAAKKKPVTKPAAPAPAPAPVPVKPAATVNWGRKLVIEEKKDHVLISVMKAGGVPSFKKVEGTLIQAMGVATGWLDDLAAEWAAKEVKQ